MTSSSLFISRASKKMSYLLLILLISSVMVAFECPDLVMLGRVSTRRVMDVPSGTQQYNTVVNALAKSPP